MSYRIAFRQLPSPTSSLPFKEWTNTLQIHLISIYLPLILSMPFPLIVPRLTPDKSTKGFSENH